MELPAFERRRAHYLDDFDFQRLQTLLMGNPAAGDLIPDSGGLRKLRFPDSRRGKGKRGGLRIVYYWWTTGLEFWLFTIYDKSDADDLTPRQRLSFKKALGDELKARRHV